MIVNVIKVIGGVVPIFEDGIGHKNEKIEICGFGHGIMTKMLNIEKNKKVYTNITKNKNLYSLYRITLDIDKSEKEYILNIIRKIKKCKNLIYICVTNSSFKGYHFLLYCRIECDVCRLVFDDCKRFMYDNYREKSFQNILFDKKELIK